MSVHYTNTRWSDKKVIVGESELRSDRPPVLLIGFHGADSTPENMLIHGNKLTLSNAVFVYPEGPTDAGEGLWSWWQDGPRQKKAVTHFLEYTAGMVEEALRHVKSLTEREPEMCMWGFSQGGAAALVYALLGTHPLSKAASICGFLPEIPDNGVRQTHSTSVLGIYGVQDEIVPSFLAEHALDELENQGHRLTRKETPQGHEVNADNIADLIRFFQSG